MAALISPYSIYPFSSQNFTAEVCVQATEEKKEEKDSNIFIMKIVRSNARDRSDGIESILIQQTADKCISVSLSILTNNTFPSTNNISLATVNRLKMTKYLERNGILSTSSTTSPHILKILDNTQARHTIALLNNNNTFEGKTKAALEKLLLSPLPQISQTCVIL